MKKTIYWLLFISISIIFFSANSCACISPEDYWNVSVIRSMELTSYIFYAILALYIGEFLLSKTLSFLNTKRWSNELPKELEDIYDKDKYSKSMEYEKVKHKFSTISGLFSFNVMILILLFSWFWELYNYLQNYTSNAILLTLYFFWIISLIQTIISLPFSYYSTFVIEEKFGFNKMTKKMFVLDNIKSILLTVILWWWILALITWIYTITWDFFRLYTWLLVTFLSVFMMMFYSSLIVPLFNKQTPLKDWKLRDEIVGQLKSLDEIHSFS